MNGPPDEQRLAFADAVHALTAEPTSVNVVRYLVASRNLEKPARRNSPEPLRALRAAVRP
jgi:hypothetical protein